MLLSSCAELSLLHRQPRHYFVTPYQERAAEYDYVSPLPMPLRPVGPAPAAGQTFRFHVGDDLPAEFEAGRLRSVTLRLRLESVSTADAIDVLINGQPLPNEGRTWDPVSYSYAWLGFPMLAAQLETLPRQGNNTFEVRHRCRVSRRPHLARSKWAVRRWRFGSGPARTTRRSTRSGAR